MASRRRKEIPEDSPIYPIHVLIKDYIKQCASQRVEAAPSIVRYFSGLVEADDPSKKVVVTDLEVCPRNTRLLATLLSNYPIDVFHVAFWRTSSGDAGVEAICEYVPMNPKLVTLELMDVGLGERGAYALSCMLQVNTTIKTLVLDFNTHLGNEGAATLAAGIKWNSTLKSLSIKYSNIGVEGVEALAGNGLGYASLKDLDLSGNPFGGLGLLSLARNLHRSATLVNLTLQDTHLVDDDLAPFEALADGLAKTTALRVLDLGSNLFSERQALCLLDAFKATPTVVTVRLPPSVDASVLRDFRDVHIEHAALNKPKKKARKPKSR